jgi:uncharacterized damage-inducible protein DinB
MKLSRTLKHWEQIHRDLLATIEMFGENELSFVPFNGSWSVGQIMLHIADCEDNWLHGVVRQEFQPWVVYDLADYPSKGMILEKLKQTHARTATYFETLVEEDLDKVFTTPNGEQFTLEWIICHVVEHEIHHRGELSLALGLLGREGLDV